MTTLHTFPTHEDLETFAEEFLKVDYDQFYEMYYGLNSDDDDVDYYDDVPAYSELEQSDYEY